MNFSIMKMSKLLFLLFYIGLVPEYYVSANTRVLLNGDSKIETIALISVKFLPFSKPVLPLMDARAFNKRVNLIAEEIVNEEKIYVDKYREAIAHNLEKYFQAVVIFGPELQKMSSFQEVFSQYNDSSSLITNDEYFPRIILSSGDLSTIPLKFGKNQNCKELIMDICAKLDVDAVAFATNVLSVLSPKTNANPLNLFAYLVLADKEGNLIVTSSAYSEDVTIGGEDVGEYIVVLDEYNEVLDRVVEKAYNSFLKKNRNLK